MNWAPRWIWTIVSEDGLQVVGWFLSDITPRQMIERGDFPRTDYRVQGIFTTASIENLA